MCKKNDVAHSISRSALLLRKGWTESYLRTRSGLTPCGTAINRWYISAPDVVLYDYQEILKVEESEEFKKFIIESDRRKKVTEYASIQKVKKIRSHKIQTVDSFMDESNYNYNNLCAEAFE